MIRIDRLDKLDKINFYQAMHSNLVKWWCFNMVDPAELLEDADDDELPAIGENASEMPDINDMDADAMAEELLADALGSDNDKMFMPDAADPFSDMDPEAAAAAMEIFNRLQAEAAADEAAKQAEIEAARAAAS